MTRMKLTVDEIAQATDGKILQVTQDSFNSFGIDSRKLPRDGLFFAMKGENTDGHLFINDAVRNGAGGAVVERAVETNVTLIEVPDSMKALQDLGAHVRKKSLSKYIGITGSSGKTSTKEFTATLLAERFSVYKSEGNLNSLTGLPLSLLSLEPTECAVFEVAMNHPGEIGRLSMVLQPHIGVVLNVNPVHAEQFPSIEAIADEKCSLVQGMADDSTLIYNADDPLLRERLKSRKVQFTYGLSRESDLRISDVRMHGVRGSRAVLRSQKDQIFVETSLCGVGNLYNIAAAVAVALSLNLSIDEITRGITRLKPYRQRGILIEKDGVHIYDDTYNSNPKALEIVLGITGESRGYKRKIAVLGDMLELGPEENQFHARAGEQVAAAGFNILIAVGPLSKFMAEAAQKKGITVYTADNSQEAAERLSQIVQQGDLVLVKGSRGMKMEEVVKRLQK
jgi:UDP-N-acetylmuramoyl-tripeptide--D-alanyl-D-alanine ligase